MKKYTTKPIDFTGCHPVIAAYLKLGKAIECEVWDDEDSGHDKRKRYITGYIPGAYLMPSGVFWSHAEPIARKVRRIMPPERAIPVLIAKGWKFCDNGDLVGYGNNVVRTAMFKLMGKPLSDPKVSSWTWPPCIIEEVEDDE